MFPCTYLRKKEGIRYLVKKQEGNKKTPIRVFFYSLIFHFSLFIFHWALSPFHRIKEFIIGFCGLQFTHQEFDRTDFIHRL